jgi:hypothetical protein
MVRWYVHYKQLWAYYIDFILWSNVCLLYGGSGSNGFMTKVPPFPMVGHYRTDIISDVGHLRLDSVVPLVLCMVAYNGWGTDIVQQVSWDSANPAEKG